MQEEDGNDAVLTFPDTGDMITLKASDYFDGTYDLSLRLVHLPGELLRIPSLEWVQLIGVEILSADSCGPQRIFVVRVEALKSRQRKNPTETTKAE